MSLLPTIGAVDQDTDFYNGVATQSLRFDDGSTPKLTHSSSSNGNRKTFTISFWMKRANISIDQMRILNSNFGNDGIFDLYFEDTDEIVFRSRSTNTNGATFEWARKSQRKFRDVSAWYHIVIAVDVTVSSPSSQLDLFAFYVNGENITSNFTNVTNSERSVGDSNVDLYWNSTTEHEIGSSGYAGQYFDGYLAEFCNIDGSALAPTSFGETKNGVWVAKKYTGSYGTNGFRLQFDQTGVGTASTSTIGADTSGNTNHFTSSGIVASDCAMPDSPENNFPTFNGLLTTNSGSLSEGNLKSNSVVGGSSKYGTNGSTFLLKSGKWYAEMLMIGGTISATFSGAVTYRNDSSTRIGFDIAIVYTTVIYSNGGVVQSSLSGISAGDVFGFAVDVDNKTCQVYKNGSTYGSQIDWSGNTYADNGFSGLGHGHGSSLSNSTIAVNYGQDSTFAGNKTSGSENAQDANGIGDFYDTVPSGFLSLCSANLSDDDLPISPNETTQADDYFNTVLYTSDNIGANGTQNVTGVGFKPDWVWLKNRTSGSTSHTLYDSSRGTGRHLSSDNTAAEIGLNSEYGYLGTFGDDGYTLKGGSTNANYVNQSTNAYASWNWKANGSTTTTNDASATSVGTIDSVYQANTTAGFSIVTYTGTGSAGTVAHGLGVAPTMIIFKNRSTTDNWIVYNKDNGNTNALFLNLTNANSTSNTFLNSTTPSSTVFNLATVANNNGSGNSIVAYCFADIEGYSKFGKYTGNGSTDGTFVFTGFRPAFCMWKRTDTAGAMWQMMDTTRDTFNVMDSYLQANSDNAEADYDFVDFVSNGFKHRHNSTHNNASGGTYIYMAFAEAPFKYANAR